MYQKECQGKKRYRSEEEAAKSAYSQMRAYLDTPDLAPYRCSYCSFWHLSKNTAAKDNKKI